jgi:hypothetical protein
LNGKEGIQGQQGSALLPPFSIPASTNNPIPAPRWLVRLFQQSGLTYARIGLEAGPLSQWLHAGLTAAGFDVILLETRYVKAALGRHRPCNKVVTVLLVRAAGVHA